MRCWRRGAGGAGADAPPATGSRPGSAGWRNSWCGADEGEVDAAVHLALILDLGNLDDANLAGARDMGAAAWLQVHALDVQQPHLAGAHRRLHRHGAHQLRLGRQLLVGDPARADRVILLDQAVDLARDLLFVQALVRQVEGEPALAVADLTAGHVALDDGGEQVQAGVHAHQAVAAVPVDLGLDVGARRHGWRARLRHMPHGLVVGALDGVDDLDRAAVRQGQAPDVPRLPAAHGVEDRAVQPDALL